MTSLRKLFGDKRGNALLLMGAGLPMLIGAAGLASDTIQWSLWKRQLQKAADSAALAAVYAKMSSQDVTAAVNYDLGDTAGSLSKNNRTGYALLGAPTVGYPANPAGGTNSVSVRLQMQHALSFTSVFMSTAPVLEANATAAAVASGEYCVVSLENTNTTGITAGGNTTVDLGCGMITNSTSLDAAVAFGSSSVKASPVAAVGGLDTTDNWATGTTLLPFTLAQADPFAAVPAPSIPSPCNQSISDKPNDSLTYSPGCYKSISIKGDAVLSPGIYIVTGGVGFDAQASVTCDGCTIILTNNTPSSTGGVDMNGGATLNMTASKTGPYAGILFYQNRGANTGTNKINGNSSSFIQGAMYFPAQEIAFSGNSGQVYNCIELVARRVTFTGNSKIKNICPSDSGAGTFKGRHVRLVA